MVAGTHRRERCRRNRRRTVVLIRVVAFVLAKLGARRARGFIFLFDVSSFFFFDIFKDVAVFMVE